MARQLSVRGEHRVDPDDAAFDPVAAGEQHGLAPEVARAIWARLARDGVVEPRRFDQVAARVAARGGRLDAVPGKLTRLDAARWGRDPAADVWADPAPGQRTRVASVQRKARRSGRPQPAEGTIAEIAARGVAGSGSDFPHRHAIEASLGRSLDARAHTGPAAQEACDALDAEAYTVGRDVAFRSASPTLELAAHEAAHVVQQGSNPDVASGLSHAGDRHEVEADELAARVVRGEPAASALRSPSSGASRRDAVQRRVADGVPDREVPHRGPAPATLATPPPVQAEPQDPIVVLAGMESARTLLAEMPGLLSGYRGAVLAFDLHAVIQLAAVLAAKWQAIVERYDQAVQLVATGTQASSPSDPWRLPAAYQELNHAGAESPAAPAVSKTAPTVANSVVARLPAFKVEVERAESHLVAGVGPGSLGGRVPGLTGVQVIRPPRGGMASFVIREAETVRDLLFTGLHVLAVMKPFRAYWGDGHDAAGERPPWEAYVEAKRSSVHAIAIHRGRPVDYFFLANVIEQRDHVLWGLLQASAGGRDIGLRGSTAIATASARQFGSTTDVGLGLAAQSEQELTDLAANFPARMFGQLMAAPSGGREAILGRLDRLGKGILGRVLEAGSWREVQALDSSVRSPALRKKLEPYFGEGASGVRHPSMRQMWQHAEIPIVSDLPLVGGPLNRALRWGGEKAHDFVSGGAVSSQSNAWEAREDGRISPDRYVDAAGSSALISLVATGASIVGGELGGAFGKGLFKGAGKLTQAIGTGMFAGAAAGPSGLFASDVTANLFGQQHGLSSLRAYAKATAEGAGIGAGLGALGFAAARYLPEWAKTPMQRFAEKDAALEPVLSKIQQFGEQLGAGLSGEVTIPLTLGQLRQLAARTKQALAALVGPELATAGPDTVFNVRVGGLEGAFEARAVERGEVGLGDRLKINEAQILRPAQPRANTSKRPSWRESELTVNKELEGTDFTDQKSFIDGKEVTRGTKDSTRPDNFSRTDRYSLDVKNYDVQTRNGRAKLIADVTSQAKGRAPDLPPGTKQGVIIDVRGQVATPETLAQIRDRLVSNSDGLIGIDDVMFISD